MQDILTNLGYLAIVTRFRRISEKLYPDGDKIYQDAGIRFKASWFTVFYVLAYANYPLTVMQVADHIDFSHITVKNIIRELESAALVEIKPNPDDKRSILISLSPGGKHLLKRLEPLWLNFSRGLQTLFEAGHPDFINILDRVDLEITKKPLHQRIKEKESPDVKILDYQPEYKSFYSRNCKDWLINTFGKLEREDLYTLEHPDSAYLSQGGFLFFAKTDHKLVGFVALKRLSDTSFEFAKLFVDHDWRNQGIATKLIDRCITRCKENEANILWLQTADRLRDATKLYQQLGFEENESPREMERLQRTEKVMSKSI